MSRTIVTKIHQALVSEAFLNDPKRKTKDSHTCQPIKYRYRHSNQVESKTETAHMSSAVSSKKPVPVELQDSILETERLGLEFMEIRKQVCGERTAHGDLNR